MLNAILINDSFAVGSAKTIGFNCSGTEDIPRDLPLDLRVDHYDRYTKLRKIRKYS